MNELAITPNEASLTFLDEHLIGKKLVQRVFGFQLEAFKDVLGAAAKDRQNTGDTLRLVLDDWSRSIGAFSGQNNRRLSLRYHWDSTQRKTNVVLFGATHMAESLPDEGFVNFMQNFLAGSHVAFRRYEKIEEASPFLRTKGDVFMYEIRQREKLFPIENPADPNDPFFAYGIYPYEKATGDLYDFCRSLTSCYNDVIVNFHLQPTLLHPAEMDSFEKAIFQLGKLADFEHRGKYSGESIRIKDQNAQYLLESYKNIRERFQECFLFVAQVVSQNKAEGEIIANRVASQIRGLSLGATVPETFMPRTAQEREAALRTFNHLWLTDWGATEATPEKRRLRFMGDANAAAAVFRLPIPAKNGLPGLTVIKPEEGFETVISNDPETKKNSLLLGVYSANGVEQVYYPLKDLTKHVLVCGASGSGKSNTTLGLLFQLWRDHKIPFWVIEPPKAEYRGLKMLDGFENTLVFSLGDEAVTPFRFNPFELLPGVMVEKHLARLESAFRSAITSASGDSEIYMTLIQSSLRNAYGNLGWDDLDTAESGADNGLSIPLMQDLPREASKIVANYADTVKRNMEAAIVNRLTPLLAGSKGHMFNTKKGFPLEELFRRPVIFELQSMGEFAPVMMSFLLMLLREQAELRRDSQLQHVTVIEEAHLLMGRVEGIESEQSKRTSTAFENLLAEIRSKGEGVFVVDQTPSKLVDGAINNTALKIIHRLAGRGEAEHVAGSVLATEQQSESIIRQGIGSACVYYPGLQGPLFIKAPAFKDERSFDDHVPDFEIKNAMSDFYRHMKYVRLRYPACVFCIDQCKHRAESSDLMSDESVIAELNDEHRSRKENDAMAPSIPIDGIIKYSGAGNNASGSEKGWCLLLHWLDKTHKPENTRQLRSIFCSIMKRRGL